MKTKWTPEREAELRRLAAARTPTVDIAVKLGVSRNTIIGYAYRKKIELSGLSSPQPGAPPTSQTAPKKATFGSARGCLYMTGDPSKGGAFCGEPALPGKAYCAPHTAICYRQVENV